MNFDLNIDNYTRDELIEMFELPPHFDRNMVDIKETKLKNNINQNQQINKEVKVQTLTFLSKAKTIILNDPKSSSLQQKIEEFYNSSYELKPTPIDDPEEHMVQVRTEKPYLSSFPSEFFPGVINPLKKRTIRKNLNIDTRFRDSYYSTSSTNFNINLPINIDNVLQMQLSAIELPTTYYVVSKQYNNNYFTITVNDATGVVTIPDGNYTQVTIMDIINTQLFLMGAPFSHVSMMANIVGTQTGSAQTMVGPNDASNNPISRLELDFQCDRNGIEDRGTPLPLKLGWNLGFRNGQYVGSLNYVSEGVIDFTGPRYVYLVVDDYNNNVNNNFYSAFNSSILNKNILARISLQATNFNILQQNNLSVVTTPREYFGPVNLYSMGIQLLDEYGRVIDLNNMDYSFCLTLVTVYDL
ncbi:MAG: hypothetical protein ACOVRN_14765 [Flavobacterium sp.]